MTQAASVLGGVGAGLAVGGLIVFSLAPDQMWLVTLCEGSALVGLIIYFVTHLDAIRTFSRQRSTRLGLQSVLMSLLLAGILAILNFLGARHSIRWDFSETQRFTLAPQTHRILRNLQREVKVTVFAQERSQGSLAYHDLLDSYLHDTEKLKVVYVDPERQPDVAKQYGITRVDTAVIESGSQSTRITAPSEADLTGAVARVAKDSKKRILFLEGHGERALTDLERGGLSAAVEALTKQGYEVVPLSLLQQHAVPEDTSVLVLAGPQRPVTSEEKERVAQYVAKGGHVMVMVDPDTQSGLDDLLLRWGVEAGRGTLVDLQDRLALGDLTALMVRTFTEHEITRGFNFAVLFPVSRHLVFHDDVAKDWDFVPLARTSPRSWAETDLRGQVVSFSPKEDTQGPLPLAAALSPKTPPGEGKPRAALVVVGNSAFASNAYINFPGNTDFLLHALGWLSEDRDLIAITPKEPSFQPYIPNPTQEQILLYVQVLLLPSVTFFAGLAIWRRRRRL
jgi:ABC-type uncharacterized transport system involved in gliding motility auxiliary subunit